MPKMKTKSAAKKRFRVRPGGTVKRGQAFKRHILTKKTTKAKRHLRGATNVAKADLGNIAAVLHQKPSAQFHSQSQPAPQLNSGGQFPGLRDFRD